MHLYISANLDGTGDLCYPNPTGKVVRVMVQQPQKRYYSLDIARILSALAVVMIHCSDGFLLKEDAWSFLTGNIFFGLSRFAVPVFIMISGALLLDESKPLQPKRFVRKNIGGLALVTLLWACIYALIFRVAKPLALKQPFLLNKFLYDLANGHFHMWYLYMMIGIYLLVPLLRCVVKAENQSYIFWFIVTSLLLQFSEPLLTLLAESVRKVKMISIFIDNLQIDHFSCHLTYFLTGWYLFHIGLQKKSHKIILFLCGALGFVFAFTYAQITRDYQSLYSSYGMPIYFYSCCIFYGISQINPQPSGRRASLLVLISGLTFGVYLIHPIIQVAVNLVVPALSNPLLSLLMTYTGVLLISLAASFLLSKIPLVKKLIRI